MKKREDGVFVWEESEALDREEFRAVLQRRRGLKLMLMHLAEVTEYVERQVWDGWEDIRRRMREVDPTLPTWSFAIMYAEDKDEIRYAEKIRMDRTRSPSGSEENDE